MRKWNEKWDFCYNLYSILDISYSCNRETNEMLIDSVKTGGRKWKNSPGCVQRVHCQPLYPTPGGPFPHTLSGSPFQDPGLSPFQNPRSFSGLVHFKTRNSTQFLMIIMHGPLSLTVICFIYILYYESWTLWIIRI